MSDDANQARNIDDSDSASEFGAESNIPGYLVDHQVELFSEHTYIKA